MRNEYINIYKLKKTFKWLCVLLPICIVLNYLTELFAFNLHAKDKDCQSDFSIMCYNVKCSDSHYKDNQVGIAEIILRESPDVVFLCEYELSKSEGLDSIILQSGEYKQYYRSKSNGVFYSKYEIDSIIGIKTLTSSGKSAKNNIIHVFHPKGVVTVVGCHLSSSRKDFIGGCKNRASEADSINKAICAEKNPLIVMGDLNDVSGSYTISRIKDIGLSDAWWEGGLGYGSTFHNKWLRLRLDHILYKDSKLDLQYVKVIDSDLSDHNALVAGFTFRQ